MTDAISVTARRLDVRVFLAAALVVLAIAMSARDPGLDVPNWLGVASALAVLVVLVGSVVRAFRADLFAPTVFFPLAVLGYYWLGSLPIGTWGHVGGGMNLLVLIAVGSFVLGASFVPGVTPQPEGAEARPTVDYRRLFTLLGLIGLACGLAFAVIWAATGVPILGVVEGSRVRASASGYINTLALTVRAVAIVGLVTLLANPSGTARRHRIALGAAIVVAVALVATTGNRGHLVLLLLAAVAAFHYLVRPLSIALVLVVATVGLVGYSLAGYQRAAQCDSEWAERVERHYGVPSEIAPLAPAYLSIRSVPVFLNAVIDEVPERHGHTSGAMLASPLITPLPGHQPGIGEFIKTNILRLEFIGFGVAAGFMAPAYIDFGYVGIVVVSLVAGALAQWLHRLARTRRLAWMAVYVFVVANLALSVYGSLVNSFSVLWVPLVAFVVLSLSERRPDEPRERRVVDLAARLRPVAVAAVAGGLAVLLMVTGGTIVQAISRAGETGGPIVIDLPGGSDSPDGGEGSTPVVPDLGCGSGGR